MREQIHTHEPIRIKNRICQYLHPYYTTAPPLLHNFTHPLLQPHISYFWPKKKKGKSAKNPFGKQWPPMHWWAAAWRRPPSAPQSSRLPSPDSRPPFPWPPSPPPPGIQCRRSGCPASLVHPISMDLHLGIYLSLNLFFLLRIYGDIGPKKLEMKFTLC